MDILVWGATSSVGRLVAEYLVGKNVSWGLGGRSREKLEALRGELGVDVPIVIGDAADPKSLDAVVKSAKVMATTVGPYALYGREFVAACARHGVDYCDITGEVLFIRDMIDLHHEEAVKSGARIVHCCGFDSIPSDLGVLMMQQGARVPEIKFFVAGARGGVGGGTAASALHQFEQAKDPKARRVLANPYALNPDPSDRGPDRGDSFDARWDADLGGWTGPFIMAGVNTRIVRRSNALMGYPYGKDFRYSEAIAFPDGVKGRVGATALSLGMKAALGGLSIGPVRKAASKLLPPPGKGPTKEQREKGFFKVKLLGGKKRGVVSGQGDPGHSETSKMLAESAICLAMTQADRKGGVLTPASAMGMPLVDRLRAAGITFSVANS